jgi:hypothetical protein
MGLRRAHPIAMRVKQEYKLSCTPKLLSVSKLPIAAAIIKQRLT